MKKLNPAIDNVCMKAQTGLNQWPIPLACVLYMSGEPVGT